ALGLRWVTRFDRQDGEAFERLGARWLEFEQPRPLARLGLPVAPPSRKPATGRAKIPLRKGIDGNSLHGLPEAAAIFGRHGKVEPSVPDSGIIGPTLQAPLQPGVGLVKPTAEQGAACSSQPDAIVTVIGRVEKHFPRVDRHRLVVVLPKLLEQLARVR